MGEQIMMIHGMWGGPWVWNNYKQFFESKGYRCLTPALRFHDKDSTDFSYDQLGETSLLDYAQDLEHEISQLNEKPILMGHSMGGLLAQMLGSRGLAKTLVLLTPASPRGILALRLSVMRSFWSTLTKPGFWKRPMLQTFDEAVYSMLQMMPVEDRKAMYEKFVPESGRAGFEIGFWLLDGKRAAEVSEARVTCPCLIISGERDKITPPSVVRSIAHKYRTVSTLKEFSHHAHWVHDEPGWMEIAEYCSEWLDQVLIAMPERPLPIAIPHARPADRVKRAISGYARKWKHMKGVEHRTSRRTQMNLVLDASIPCSGNAQYYEIGYTMNICQGGIYLDTDAPLEEGMYVNANLHTGRAEKPLWIQGRVVRTAGNGMALAFSHVEPERLNRLLLM